VNAKQPSEKGSDPPVTGSPDDLISSSVPFSPGQPAEFFLQFAAAPAVFALRGAEERSEPYVSKTANLRRRLQRLLAPPVGQSKRLNLRERVARIEYSLTGSDFESGMLLYRLLRKEFPQTYQKRLRLHPASVIKLNLENAFPRAYITTRLGRPGGQSLFYGPFRSRALAEKFMNDSLDLFKIRRCTFELNPDPSFPGCVYSEMKMCLAPCFKGCTDEAYAAEVARVQAYFDSGGESLVQELEAERDRLSEALDFEGAAQQHAKIMKVKSILSGTDEICRRLGKLDAVIIQPSAEKDAIALFRFRHGALLGPALLKATHERASEADPVEQKLQGTLETLIPAKSRSVMQMTEELAILKRWYYRSHKTGEIIFARVDGELPIRKLLNAVHRVAHPKTETANDPTGEATPQ
jgi:excinuclease UvrABC nuclease subunit